MLKTIPYSDYPDAILLKANPDYPIDTLREFYNPKTLSEGVVVCEGGLGHLIPDHVSFSEGSMLFYKKGILKEGFELHLLDAKQTHSVFEKYSEVGDEYLSNYGVCDNAEQVIEKYNLKDSELQFTVALRPVRKISQPRLDGWRWEKWGEYIGIQVSKADYLFDEPEIEMVYTYRIIIWS